jgi:hypothetical protein
MTPLPDYRPKQLSVGPLEAEILILIKDKKLETKYKIGFDNVKTAFPDIQWGGRV